MRIYRFDAEVSVPIDRFGSRFRIGPLTGPAEGSVHMIHLPPGGLIGRHPTVTRQLFAVVDGSGWVSGNDGERRPIATGYAAVWEPGEEHDAVSDGGLTAVCVEGSFDVWAVAVTADIEVVEYDPAWPDWFGQLHDHIWPAVSDVAVRIDHVGSTSVPGLAAKPIIDMDIVVRSDDEVRLVIERLGSLGYRWRGDLGVPGRQAFLQLGETTLPAHHLYLVVEDNKAHLDHWLLRDLLRQDPDARARYADLKRRNAELAAGDMDVYVAAKARLVAELLTRARAERGLPPADYWEPG
ncbi:MAG TPA: GrpB family protein [Acidimicrobiales bacterium]|nr:GrpB family protein [Acidimicrobiales bacterium]